MQGQRVINQLRNDKPFSFIDINTNDVAYCPRCEKGGVRSILGERIYNEGTPIPEDHDNWCQCPRCGEIIPIYEQSFDTDGYEPIIDLPDNPFDGGSEFEAVKKRKPINRLGSQVAKDEEEDFKTGNVRIE